MRRWTVWALALGFFVGSAVADAQVPREPAGDRPVAGEREVSPDRPPADRVASPSAPPPSSAPARPPAPPNPALISAVAAQNIANALTLVGFAWISLTFAYFLTFVSKSALGPLKTKVPGTYVVLVRVALGISAIAIAAGSYGLGGPLAAIAAVGGALAAPLLHDAMDAVRAVKRFAPPARG